MKGKGEEEKRKEDFSAQQIAKQIEFRFCSLLTVAVLRFRIKCVSRSAALRSNTSITADSIIAAVGLQALVVIDLALVDILAGVSERIESESDSAIAPEAAREVRADLISVAGFLIH